MDEASSRFVDQLVTQKLVSEKLAKVSHRPACALEQLLGRPFENFVASPSDVVAVEDASGSSFALRSPIECAYPENRWVKLLEHLAPRPRGAILLLHGLFEDNRAIYGYFIGELVRLGYSVYQTTLPFHYERKPEQSQFSGEFFLSAELQRTQGAFRQASLELQQCHAWLTQRLSIPLHVVGFSMGGAIALTVAGLTKCAYSLCIVNPATKLRELVWTSPLCKTISDDLLASGAEPALIDEVLATFDPCALAPKALAAQNILMIYGQYDQVTLPRQYEDMIRHFALPKVLRYKAGHLNTLRVPRMAEDIVRFFASASSINASSAESLP